ncbi:hypothetical protein AVEN_163941-1, partial [Araneus ventricosus]
APYTADLQWNRVSNLEPSGPKAETLPLGHRGPESSRERRTTHCDVIQFLGGENIPFSEIHHRLQQQYGEKYLSRTCVFEWCKCFKEG